MKVNINKKVLMIGGIVPIIFSILNFGVFKVKFNFVEIVMFTVITFFTIYFYGKAMDYLNPAVFFPILYFALYWLGDFDFGFYPAVPLEVWYYYLLGIIGYYVGVLIIDKVKIKITQHVEQDYLSVGARSVLVIVFLFCVVLKLYVYKKSGIPLLAANIDASRQSIAESYSAVKVLSTPYTIIPVFMFYDIVSRKRNDLKISLFEYFVIFLAFLFAILDVSRLLIIQMFIPMFLIFVLKVKRIKLKTLLLILAGVVVFIGGNKIIRNILDNPGYLSYIRATRNTNMVGNILLSAFTSFRVGIDDLRQLIDIVPSQHDYTYGQMFMNSILSPLPGKQVVIGYYVADLLGMSFDGIGAATTILGMFYLDGGPLLVFAGMLLFALFTSYFYKKYIKCNNVTIYTLVAIYVLYYTINTLRTNVMPTIEPILVLFYYCIFGKISKIVR